MQTVCVDDLVEEIAKKSQPLKRVIVKLDVEGAEIESLKGSLRTLANYNTLLIFEDHGFDPSSKMTDTYLHHGLHVYYIDAQTHAVRSINKAEELTAIKTNPRRGYNFFACVPGSEFDQEFQRMTKDTGLGQVTGKSWAKEAIRQSSGAPERF